MKKPKTDSDRSNSRSLLRQVTLLTAGQRNILLLPVSSSSESSGRMSMRDLEKSSNHTAAVPGLDSTQFIKVISILLVFSGVKGNERRGHRTINELMIQKRTQVCGSSVLTKTLSSLKLKPCQSSSCQVVRCRFSTGYSLKFSLGKS